MKIFLDVGSHFGDTLDEVIKQEHMFDKIYAFEPSTHCLDKLQKYKNDIVTINHFGLSNHSGEANLYDTGTGAASIYQDKCDFVDKTVVEKIKLVEASTWITDNLSPQDIIYLKLNCEGSECDIIENLIQNGVYDIIDHIMIDFDVRKIPSQHHRQHEILNLLHGKKNFHLCEQVMIGNTHVQKIRNWLSVCCK
jgi:FkbM family methyltransferase